MKQLKVASLLLLTITLFSCQFNQSVNKDLTTGAFSKGDGLSCEDITIKINGKAEKRNTFTYGEKVEFNFENIAGLIEEGGKAFPAMSMVIIKNEKDTAFNAPNLLTDLESGTDLSPLVLKANFISALPFENNEKYKVLIKITDKKSKGTFEYELPFTVQKNNFLKVNSKDITYSNIYLWDETEQYSVVSKEINVEHVYILILEGLNGLEVTDNKVYPVLSTEIVDNKGDTILANPNTLADYKENGVEYEQFKQAQLTVNLTFKPGKVSNPCRLKATLMDQKSNKRLETEAIIDVFTK